MGRRVVLIHVARVQLLVVVLGAGEVGAAYTVRVPRQEHNLGPGGAHEWRR